MYKVAILGAGYISESHAEALKRTAHADLVAVCDINQQSAEKFAARWQLDSVYSDLDALLQESDCQSVHILLPPQHHARAAQKIITSGRDVFLEKPICVSSAECKAIESEATEFGSRVGVNHNFLFLPAWERLRSDIDRKVFGPIDHVHIDWQFPLGQLDSGPFDHWMFAEPGNILLEVAPHVFAFLIDLVGRPDHFECLPGDRIELPNGQHFYRRWLISGSKGRTSFEIIISLGAGYPRRTVTVRGQAATATCDYERNHYEIESRSHHVDPIIGSIYAAFSQNWSSAMQSVQNLAKYVGSVGKLGPFELSITRSIDEFYANAGGGDIDSRHSVTLASEGIRICEQIGSDLPVASLGENSAESVAGSIDPKILVIGGTGFIGRHLVRNLTEKGHNVRVMSRNPAAPGYSANSPHIEIFKGAPSSTEDMGKALKGVDVVYHLARAYGTTWEEYYENDVLKTKSIAEACFAAGVRRFIYTGTIDSYFAGDQRQIITEGTPLDTHIKKRNDYARAKAASEKLLMEMHRELGLPLVIARPGIVIGGAREICHWGVGNWLTPFACKLWGDGHNKLPFVLVEDVAEALAQMLDVPDIDGSSFNLVGDQILSAREYIAAYEDASGTMIQIYPTAILKWYLLDMIKYLLKLVARRGNAQRPSYRDWKSRTQLSPFDCSSTKKRLNWSPCADREELIERGIVRPSRE